MHRAGTVQEVGTLMQGKRECTGVLPPCLRLGSFFFFSFFLLEPGPRVAQAGFEHSVYLRRTLNTVSRLWR